MGCMMEKEVYFGYILKADLRGALNYLSQDPAQSDLYAKYMAIFEREEYLSYGLGKDLDDILAVYQKYWREVFYLEMKAEIAEERLKNRLSILLGYHDSGTELGVLEQIVLPQLFSRSGFTFMGGKTSGYYGPYVWRTTETVQYQVELPDGTQTYTVKLLDGFVNRSWIDFLSFGAIGPGGWADGEGYINCVKSAWDLDSEAFRISLLKHEAQHAKDLETYSGLSSADLEYRAKLVELIYSTERNLLLSFAQEADDSAPDNGHSLAAYRIVRDFSEMLRCDHFTGLEIGSIQKTALELYRRDCELRQ